MLKIKANKNGNENKSNEFCCCFLFVVFQKKERITNNT